MVSKLFSKGNMRIGAFLFGVMTVGHVVMVITLPSISNQIQHNGAIIMREEPEFDSAMRTWVWLMAIGTVMPLAATLFCVRKGFRRDEDEQKAYEN